MGRLILDTGVLIEIERGGVGFNEFDSNDDLSIAAVTAAELAMGIELGNQAHRQRREDFLEGLLGILSVENYTLETSRAHAALLAHARRQGRRRGDHDLIIAATAAHTGRTIVTTDKAARFADLPGVDCLVLEQQ